MAAQVFFIAAQAENALVWPVAALRFEDRGAGARQDTDEGTRTAKVQVMGPGGQREERTVQVGVTDRVHAEIVSGLEEGEQVVIGLRATGQSSGGSMRIAGRVREGPRRRPGRLHRVSARRPCG